MDTIAIAYSELRSYGCARAVKSLLMNDCRFTMVEVDSQLRHAVTQALMSHCSSCPFRSERAHWLQTAEKQWRVATRKLTHKRFGGDSV